MYGDCGEEHSILLSDRTFTKTLMVSLLLQDFANNTLTLLTEANTTYPHGYCSAQ